MPMKHLFLEKSNVGSQSSLKKQKGIGICTILIGFETKDINYNTSGTIDFQLYMFTNSPIDIKSLNNIMVLHFKEMQVNSCNHK